MLDKIEVWGPNWLDHVADADVERVSTAWMANLDSYGFWEIADESRRRTELPTPAGGYSFPDYLELRAWAKIRLLQGLAQNAPEIAGREVRQLAWLCFTHENLLAAMNAMHLLRYERDAFDRFASARGKADSWQPMSLEDLWDFRKALWTAVHLSKPESELELTMAGLADSSPIACIALSERAFSLAVMSGYSGLVGEDVVLGGSPFRKAMGCRLNMARTFLAFGAGWIPTYPLSSVDLPLTARPGAWLVSRFAIGQLARRAPNAFYAAYVPANDLRELFP